MRSADDRELKRTKSSIGVPNLSDTSLLTDKSFAGNDPVIASFFISNEQGLPSMRISLAWRLQSQICQDGCKAASPPPSLRTAGELRERAAVVAQERERARRARINVLRARGEAAWTEV